MTRNSLKDGNISELQLKDGDFSITPEFRIWAQAVDEVAVNINKALDILVQIRGCRRQWRYLHSVPG